MSRELPVFEERKALIIRATAEYIEECGYQNFSLQEVARRAHLSKGIVHYYFLNRDDLMAAVLWRWQSLRFEPLVEKLQASPNPAMMRFEDFVAGLFAYHTSDREYWPILIDFWHQRARKDLARLLVERIVAMPVDALKGLLGELVAEGHPLAMEADTLARLIFTFAMSLHLGVFENASPGDKGAASQSAEQRTLAYATMAQSVRVFILGHLLGSRRSTQEPTDGHHHPNGEAALTRQDGLPRPGE